MFISFSLITLLSAILSPAPELHNNRFEIFLQNDHSWIVKERHGHGEWRFKPEFVVINSEDDPGLAMRPAGIKNVMYNVVTWKSRSTTADNDLRQTKIADDVAGDGFDDRILKGDNQQRTPDVFQAGRVVHHGATTHTSNSRDVTFAFEPNKLYDLSAALYFDNAEGFPILRFSLIVHREGYYSVGYVGAPEHALEETSEIWQPLVWQEKRFPSRSFLTLAFQCPIPSALVTAGGSSVGVVADPNEFPFDPLPLLDNSPFGVAIRTQSGNAKPMLFAPVSGGKGSHMNAGTNFDFQLQLFVTRGSITEAFETIARDIYGFKDYRKNTTHTLNQTLDNMLDYGMSEYSMFVDSLKGCAYSTDVPGAVKNVSSLNPFQMALLADREDIFRKRAYPIMEFLLSREKFLFTLDSTQKIQNPSRKMNGPVAPVSELAALFQISGRKSTALANLARTEFNKNRTRNLSVEEKGDTWQNALAMYNATNEKQFLDKAINGANEYIERRVKTPSKDFHQVEGGFFFWNGFTPDWINLFQLYEVTRDTKFLEAASYGARHYTMFCWFAPRIPDDSILINKGNKAPHYWYLKSKGHPVMPAAEELVPAWRLSEIGLTPESSGTASGHRAIFMANYAPWMLRIGYLTGDEFLIQTARAAIVGRYANFPGYHINTARTTVYEKKNYPLRPFKELSVNSFHFNHIWPHMSILVDYLFTDAFVKSKGQIDLPSAYIQGYAYLQSKFYGYAPGIFYGEKNVYPWMPPSLLTTGSKQLNYVAFRGNNALYIAFMNQSGEKITSPVTLDPSLFSKFRSSYNTSSWRNNEPAGTGRLVNGKLTVDVDPHSISAVKIQGLTPVLKFQGELYDRATDTAPRLTSLQHVNGEAIVLDFGRSLRTLYVYLHSDDQKIKQAVLYYTRNRKSQVLSDKDYPFEFTIPLPAKSGDEEFSIQVTDRDGKVTTEPIPLGQ